jgi:flavin-dependent dehydrogenase
MQPIRYDVVIVGAGPAGAAAAITLARSGASVVLLDRTAVPGSRAGEMLPPQAQRWLEQLGVAGRFLEQRHARSPGVVAVWESDRPRTQEFVFQPHGGGWIIDRAKFDSMLRTAASDAGTMLLLSAVIRDLRRSERGTWELVMQQPGVNRLLQSRFIIDASGRSGWMAGRLGARRIHHDRLVGVLGRLSVQSADHRLLLEAIPHGWWYSVPLAGGDKLAAMLTDEDLLPRGAKAVRQFWRQRLAEAPWTWAACGVTGPIPLRTVSAVTSRLETFAGIGWLAVGDAACARDPLSSSGISMALESGICGGLAVIDALAGRPRPFEDYSSWLEAEDRRSREHQQAYYRMVRRWPDAIFWRRRRASSPDARLV